MPYTHSILQQQSIQFHMQKMFRICGCSVAMGSGGDECNAADYVTAGVDEDGLYKAFEKLSLL